VTSGVTRDHFEEWLFDTSDALDGFRGVVEADVALNGTDGSLMRLERWLLALKRRTGDLFTSVVGKAVEHARNRA
jgi:hypothetical protein